MLEQLGILGVNGKQRINVPRVIGIKLPLHDDIGIDWERHGK